MKEKFIEILEKMIDKTFEFHNLCEQKRTSEIASEMCEVYEKSKELKQELIRMYETTDETLLQEIQSLKEKLKIATEIIKKYEPNLDVNDFNHDIGTEDYLSYIEK